MTYEENMDKAQKLGYSDAWCIACNNISTPTSAVCKKCIAYTPAFTEAVNVFMKAPAKAGENKEVRN